MIARYDHAVLCTLGDLVEDVVVWLHESINYGTDTPARIVRRRGGSAANVAAFAAATGAASRFVGQVGADDTGARLLARLHDDGVDTVVARGGRTGSIVVVVDPTGERTMLTDRGAAIELTQLPAGALDDMQSLHVPFVLRTFASTPFSVQLFLLPMWPFAFLVMLAMWAWSKTFVISCYSLRGRLHQTWAVPRYGFQVRALIWN